MLKVKFFDPAKDYLRFRKEYDQAWESVNLRGDLILRKDTEEFEERLANYVGTKYAVALSSGTDAIYLSLKALGIKGGVALPSHTFKSTCGAVINAGAIPLVYDMDGKIDEIFNVAGVTKFKDTKLKNFSSGMTARLAFALMIQNDPDVLLLDEIFAVGDKDFIPQCLAVFEDYKKKGKTVLFASHDLDAVLNNCDRTILLHNGKMEAFGPTREVINLYNSL